MIGLRGKKRKGEKEKHGEDYKTLINQAKSIKEKRRKREAY
jgi:hypothetical protein